MNIESAIQWFSDRLGKVTYSMTDRRGPNSYDCSSSVYYSLIAGGCFPIGIYIGNTDSLFNDLEKYGWAQLQPNAQGNFDTQRGDVFIWGNRGASSGGVGHTGMFIDADNIIHCSYGYNGIATSNYDWLRSINGSPEQTFYRFVGGVTNNPTDQQIEIGSFIKFDKTLRVDDVEDIADVWQVKTALLCPASFTWADNGIPASALIEVDAEGYATSDQSLDVGSLYKLPGKFQVLDVGPSGDRWMAEIQINGLNLWVDLEPATEVAADDPGTSTPISRPTPPAVPPTPPAPVTPPTPPAPATPPTPTKIPVTTPDEAPVAPSVPATLPTDPVEQENNSLLKQILALLQALVNKITSIYK